MTDPTSILVAEGISRTFDQLLSLGILFAACAALVYALLACRKDHTGMAEKMTSLQVESTRASLELASALRDLKAELRGK